MSANQVRYGITSGNTTRFLIDLVSDPFYFFDLRLRECPFHGDTNPGIDNSISSRMSIIGSFVISKTTASRRRTDNHKLQRAMIVSGRFDVWREPHLGYCEPCAGAASVNRDLRYDWNTTVFRREWYLD